MTAVLRFETTKEYVRVRAHSKIFKNFTTTKHNSCSENLPSVPKARKKKQYPQLATLPLNQITYQN